MGLLELLLIAVGLSMDAFAVAVCKGLSIRGAILKPALTVGFYFGASQALMPLAGYFAGTWFAEYITAFDHWAAFVILTIIGAKMLKDSFDGQVSVTDASLAFKVMLPLTVATSIDALAVGITFAFFNVHIVPAVTFIGFVTFALSAAGVAAGRAAGARLRSKAELLGGIILILIGIKILVEHTF
ncbi:MAG: manganese efflux pump MntP family protein [Clostridiales bacterium]|jgi:putative Mn2+ efflux pump MntP|nr:manganese efflux pump MntP family protein [Clostridiales bacterium]